MLDNWLLLLKKINVPITQSNINISIATKTASKSLSVPKCARNTAGDAKGKLSFIRQSSKAHSYSKKIKISQQMSASYNYVY